MTDRTEIARIAAGLSKAQRAYLTEKAEWRDPTGYYGEKWMTFPPRSTHDVLMRLGLVDRSGGVLELGLAVRDYLKERGDT